MRSVERLSSPVRAWGRRSPSPINEEQKKGGHSCRRKRSKLAGKVETPSIRDGSETGSACCHGDRNSHAGPPCIRSFNDVVSSEKTLTDQTRTTEASDGRSARRKGAELTLKTSSFRSHWWSCMHTEPGENDFLTWWWWHHSERNHKKMKADQIFE